MYRTIRDAISSAATSSGPDDLFSSFRPAPFWRCLSSLLTVNRLARRTLVCPRPGRHRTVRRRQLLVLRDAPGHRASRRVRAPSSNAARPSVRKPRDRRRGRTVLHPSAIVDRQASVIGRVTVRDYVYVARASRPAPGVNAGFPRGRVDPSYGVTRHATKGSHPGSRGSPTPFTSAARSAWLPLPGPRPWFHGEAAVHRVPRARPRRRDAGGVLRGNPPPPPSARWSSASACRRVATSDTGVVDTRKADACRR